MINNFFRRGDLVKHVHVDYFATSHGDIDSTTEEEIALFLRFTSPKQMDTCKIYIFCDSKIITVAVHNLILLSKNEK